MTYPEVRTRRNTIIALVALGAALLVVAVVFGTNVMSNLGHDAVTSGVIH